MSLALKTDEIRLQKLTVLAAVATAKAIEALSGKTVGIKWVNDIYIGNKKLCGILCERVANPTDGKTLGVVIGIGVNLFVKDFPPELHAIAVSLNKNGITPKKLAIEITNQILSLTAGGQDFMQYYKEKSILLGKEITYIKNNNEYIATAVDIDDSGALIVKDSDQNTIVLSSGDVMLKK